MAQQYVTEEILVTYKMYTYKSFFDSLFGKKTFPNGYTRVGNTKWFKISPAVDPEFRIKVGDTIMMDEGKDFASYKEIESFTEPTGNETALKINFTDGTSFSIYPETVYLDKQYCVPGVEYVITESGSRLCYKNNSMRYYVGQPTVGFNVLGGTVVWANLMGPNDPNYERIAINER